MPKLAHTTEHKTPRFVAEKKFHDPHKSNLPDKDFDYYSKFSWPVEGGIPYYWSRSQWGDYSITG